jgi:hypothetical protein
MRVQTWGGLHRFLTHLAVIAKTEEPQKIVPQVGNFISETNGELKHLHINTDQFLSCFRKHVNYFLPLLGYGDRNDNRMNK